MTGSEFYVALILGIALSLLYAEFTGVVPAGLIVPGYLALVVDQPIYLISLLIISVLTYLIVNYGLNNLIILYGRRQFTAMVLVGIALKLIFISLYPSASLEPSSLTGIGLVIPGLIANTIQKQGTVHTLSSTIILTALTYGAILAYRLF